MRPVFVRQRPDGPAMPALPGELSGLSATTEVALSAKGPFAPLALALEDDAELREAFVRGLRLPTAETWAKVRFWLLLGTIPLLMLAELDRELSRAGIAGATPRLVGDGLVLAVVVLDLLRRIPRHPRFTAALLLSAVARFALLVARPCGAGVHPSIFVAPLLSAAAAAVLLALAKPGPKLAAEVLARLGIGPDEVVACKRARAPARPHLGAALLSAVGLPLLLAVTRRLGLWPQAALFVGYAAIVPFAVERLFEPPRRAGVRWSRVLPAGVLALGLTLGMTSGAHHAFDASVYAVRCVNPAAFEQIAEKALVAEAKDMNTNVERARQNLAFFLMTVAVVPLVEERVFRGLLQRVLARRYGHSRAIVLSSLLFGLAHLGVYKIAVYQTVLLGVGFGTAFALGGYPAAVLAHALWNLSLVL